MPFNPEALLELRRREGFSQGQLLKDLELRIQYFTCQAVLSNWETGVRIPHVPEIDKLYRYASIKGHKDLEFYVTPDRFDI